jgi:hypothetical protein
MLGRLCFYTPPACGLRREARSYGDAATDARDAHVHSSTHGYAHGRRYQRS